MNYKEIIEYHEIQEERMAREICRLRILNDNLKAELLKMSREKHPLTSKEEAEAQVKEFDKVQPVDKKHWGGRKTAQLENKKPTKRKVNPEKPKDKTPPPGSKEAIIIGCTCPVIDNYNGQGYMGQEDIYVYNMDCPVHIFNYEEPEEK